MPTATVTTTPRTTATSPATGAARSTCAAACPPMHAAAMPSTASCRLATALGLLERGVDGVVVLDAQHVGFGASGRNGGFVFGGYSLDCADLLAQLGPQQARAAYALTRDALRLIRARIARHAIDCDAVEGGALLVNWFDDDAILRRQQALMAEHFGVEWELVA